LKKKPASNAQAKGHLRNNPKSGGSARKPRDRLTRKGGKLKKKKFDRPMGARWKNQQPTQEEEKRCLKRKKKETKKKGHRRKITKQAGGGITLTRQKSATGKVKRGKKKSKQKNKKKNGSRRE